MALGRRTTLLTGERCSSVGDQEMSITTITSNTTALIQFLRGRNEAYA
jgi:hypothetical protein